MCLKIAGIILGFLGYNNIPYITLQPPTISFSEACRNNDMNAVNFYLGIGADPNKEEYLPKEDCETSPLKEASSAGHTSLARLLIQNGGNIHQRIDYQNETFLHCAIRVNRFKEVRSLVECGIDINATNKIKETALHYVCSMGRSLEMLNYLLEHNADIEAVDEYENTPLCTAYLWRHYDIAERLLEMGANADYLYSGGGSIIYTLLGSHDDEESKKALNALVLKHKIDVNKSEIRRNLTPLLASCVAKNRSMVEKLIAHKANVNAKTVPDGMSALHWTLTNRQDMIGYERDPYDSDDDEVADDIKLASIIETLASNGADVDARAVAAPTYADYKNI